MDLSRRRLLTVVAASSGVALTGCVNGGGDGEPGGDDEETTESSDDDGVTLPLPPDASRIELTAEQKERFKGIGDFDSSQITAVWLYEGKPTRDIENNDHVVWFRNHQTVGQWTQVYAQGQVAMYRDGETGLYIFFGEGNPVGESQDPMRDYFYVLQMPWSELRPAVPTDSS